MLGQAIGGYTNATHGMTLSAVSLAYYRYLSQFAKPKFKRFAQVVWNVNQPNLSDDEIIEEGFKRMESWMKELGLALKISELGVKESMIDDIVNLVIPTSGYKALTKEEIKEVYLKSL